MIGPEASGVLVGVGSPFCGPAAPSCAAAGSYELERAYGATPTQAMVSATVAGVSSIVFTGISSISNAYVQVGASAVASGVFGELNGGSFGRGFTSSLVGALPLGGGGYMMGAVRSAVVGGTVSRMSGGKFANGAATGAFSYVMTWGAKRMQAGGKTLQDSSVPGDSTPDENYVGEAVYEDAMTEAQRQVAEGRELDTSSFDYKDQYVVAEGNGGMFAKGGGRKVFAAGEWRKVKGFFNGNQSKGWGIVNGEYDSVTKTVVLYRSSTHSEQGFIPGSSQTYRYSPMERALGTIFHEGYHVRFPNAPGHGHPAANWEGDNAVYRYRQYLKSNGN